MLSRGPADGPNIFQIKPGRLIPFTGNPESAHVNFTSKKQCNITIKPFVLVQKRNMGKWI
jgi:hypothetical protein